MEFGLHDLHRHRLPHYNKILAYMHAHTCSIRDLGRRRVFADILSQVVNHFNETFRLFLYNLVLLYLYQLFFVVLSLGFSVILEIGWKEYNL